MHSFKKLLRFFKILNVVTNCFERNSTGPINFFLKNVFFKWLRPVNFSKRISGMVYLKARKRYLAVSQILKPGCNRYTNSVLSSVVLFTVPSFGDNANVPVKPELLSTMRTPLLPTKSTQIYLNWEIQQRSTLGSPRLV